MQLTELQIQELRIAFNTWRAIQDVKRLPYPPEDDGTFRLLAARAVKYGALDGTRSSWARAAKELSDEGKIRLHIPPPEPTPIPDDFTEQIRRMSSSELLKRLNTDRAFSDLYGRWAAEGDRPSEGTPHSTSAIALTLEQYYSIPASVLARRYAASPEFREAVDKLFSSGDVRTTNIVESKS